MRRLGRQIPLDELKRHAGSGGVLADMHLFKYGRLSVQSVMPAEWEYVLGLEDEPPGAAAAAAAGAKQQQRAKGKGAAAPKQRAAGGKKQQ